MPDSSFGKIWVDLPDLAEVLRIALRQARIEVRGKPPSSWPNDLDQDEQGTGPGLSTRRAGALNLQRPYQLRGCLNERFLLSPSWTTMKLSIGSSPVLVGGSGIPCGLGSGNHNSRNETNRICRSL